MTRSLSNRVLRREQQLDRKLINMLQNLIGRMARALSVYGSHFMTIGCNLPRDPRDPLRALPLPPLWFLRV